MKELTIEQKAKAYDEALRIAQELYNDTNSSNVGKGYVCTVFPELKESEDERIRKRIVLCLEECVHNDIIRDYEKDKCLAWLEKKDEQKLIDKVEPKFKVGDWIVHYGTENIYKVVAVIDNQYQLKYGDNYTVQKCADVDRCARLWDITKDAKDGDVLIYNHQLCKGIFIFKRLYSPIIVLYYIMLSEKNKIYVDDSISTSSPSRITPATKEQCDALMKAMKDARYTFDFEKKELKKIEENEIEIPFGAKDSELQEASYHIPKGFYAVLDGNKVIIKRFKNPRPQNN